MAIKFYNPGTKIDDTLRFDHPTNDPKYQNNISYYQLHAEPQSFFEVPTVLVIKTETGGEVEVPVRFAPQIKLDYKSYGLVQINPNLEPAKIHPDDNVAANEKDAKEKGDRLWQEYIVEKAREYILQVEQVRAMGGVPMRAKGVYAHALKSLNMSDPADLVGNQVVKTADDARFTAMQKQIEELTKLVGKK
jgi:hypothetical protein